MSLIDNLIAVADLVLVGILIICLVKISSKKKYWSYWEQFQRSKEVLPVPDLVSIPPENKPAVKKLLKIAGVCFLALIVLIIIQFHLPQ